MSDKVLRVAVISTGGVGSIAVPAVARRSDFDLVGVWVHSPDKVGVDAGELVGMGPIGLAATGDLDEIIALAPDCAVYTATSDELDAAAVRDYVRLLEAGINVVTTNTPGMMFPDGWIPEFVDQVRAAALKGGVTAYTSGIEPGFAGDQLVVVLTTLSKTIRSVRAQEIFDYSDYPNTHMMFDVMGFGKPLDYTPILAFDGVQQFAWGPPIRFGRACARHHARRNRRELRTRDHAARADCRRRRHTRRHVRSNPDRDDGDGRRQAGDHHRTRQSDGARHRTAVADGTERHLPHPHRRRTEHDVRSAAWHARDGGHRRNGRHRNACRQRDPLRRRSQPWHRHLTRHAADRAAPSVGRCAESTVIERISRVTPQTTVHSARQNARECCLAYRECPPECRSARCHRASRWHSWPQADRYQSAVTSKDLAVPVSRLALDRTTCLPCTTHRLGRRRIRHRMDCPRAPAGCRCTVPSEGTHGKGDPPGRQGWQQGLHSLEEEAEAGLRSPDRSQAQWRHPRVQ